MDDATPTRHKVLEAAADVFLEHGFDGASMEQVRQRAGVSNGSLYHHYPTKAQLADAVYGHTLRDFHATLLAPLRAKASAEAGVKGMVRAYINWVVAHRAHARLLHKLGRSVDMASTERGSANTEVFGTLRQWVEQKIEGGEMRPMPLNVWMALVVAPAMSLTGQWVKSAEPSVSPKVRAALEQGAWLAVAP